MERKAGIETFLASQCVANQASPLKVWPTKAWQLVSTSPAEALTTLSLAAQAWPPKAWQTVFASPSMAS
eukprot:904875-Pelagomonas_calceolata.AAC.3